MERQLTIGEKAFLDFASPLGPECSFSEQKQNECVVAKKERCLKAGVVLVLRSKPSDWIASHHFHEEFRQLRPSALNSGNYHVFSPRRVARRQLKSEKPQKK